MYGARMAHRVCHSIIFSRQLHKLELPFAANMPASSDEWDFHLLEIDDLVAASELVVLLINETGATYEELNWFVRRFAKLGYRSRSGRRLYSPNMTLTSDSCILGATRRGTSDIIGVAEICVDRPRGRLSPLMKSIFRSNTVSKDEEPYLCNLFISKLHRRKGLARLMCELSEELVQLHWNKSVMYLHVEKSNVAAQALYIGMGYEVATPELSEIEKKIYGVDGAFYYSNQLKLQWDVKKI